MGNRIIRYIIPQKVRVRKFEVDVEKLKQTLKYHKNKSGYSNKQISEVLGQPKTLVDHWFRYDNSFSIPNEELWMKLKEILKIETDEFDRSIMSFEVRDGIYDKSNRVYDTNGISPTTLARTDNAKIINNRNFKIRKLTPLECWRLMGFDDEDFYNAKELGLSDSSLYKLAGNSIVVNCLYYIFKKVFKEYIVK